MYPTMQSVLRLFVLAVVATVTTAAEANTQPNVVYILADDLGYGDLSCYGQTKFDTPNIDRLASEGLKFTDHYSGNTVCSPSRAVLMTGLHSGHCYLRGNTSGERGAQLDPNRTVLPEIFKAAGYMTGAFGKWGMGHTNVAGASNPLTHGVDHFFGWKSQSIAHTYYPSSVVENGKEIPLDSGTFVHDIIMERASGFIRNQVNDGKPFFCYIPTAVPHAAMHAPPELHEKWRKVFPQFDGKIGKYGAGPGEVCPDVQNPIAGFAAMMENLDNQVGSIVNLLDELGVDDNTLIMFTSDNGAHKEGGHDPKFWNSTGGLRGHKRDMHEGGIRTPMLARWPKTIAAGGTTNHISGFQDVLPTIAELIGETAPADCDGISFLPTLLAQDGKQRRHPFLYFEFCKGADQKIFSQAVRMGPWKGYREKRGDIEVYHLGSDPYETANKASEKPDIIRQIEDAMAAAHTSLPTQ